MTRMNGLRRKISSLKDAIGAESLTGSEFSLIFDCLDSLFRFEGFLYPLSSDYY
jgi:hypothetical protein